MRDTTILVLGIVLVALGCGGGSGDEGGDGPTSFPSASLVIGQPDFTSSAADHGSPPAAANGFSNPNGLAVNGSHLLVAI